MLKLGTQRKRKRKISETKLHHNNEIQALQTAILGPSLSSHDSWEGFFTISKIPAAIILQKIKLTPQLILQISYS